jgi:hypothetical protein
MLGAEKIGEPEGADIRLTGEPEDFLMLGDAHALLALNGGVPSTATVEIADQPSLQSRLDNLGTMGVGQAELAVSQEEVQRLRRGARLVINHLSKNNAANGNRFGGDPDASSRILGFRAIAGRLTEVIGSEESRYVDD